MEDRIIVDTNILIGVLRDNKQAVEKLESHNDQRLFTTDINAFELYFGAYRSSQKETNLAQAKGILNSLSVLSTDEDSMEVAAEIAADLEEKGKKLEIKDVLIASIATVNGCSVLTENTDHFNRIGVDLAGKS